MGIKVVYAPDLQVAGQIGIDTGMGNLRTQAQQIAQQDAMRQQALDEQARQFDMSMAMRARSEYLQGQQRNAQLAAQQRSQQASQVARIYAQNQQNQFQLMRDQQAQDFGQQDMLLQSDLVYGRQQAMGVEEQANLMMKEARKLKYDPTGQNILNTRAAELREIQGAPLRPEARADALAQWMEKFQSDDPSQYQIKAPSGYDDVESWMPLEGQQIAPGQPPAPGFYWGKKGMRNGEPEWGRIYIPDPQNPTGYGTFADGTAYFRDSETGDPVPLPGKKASELQKPIDEVEQINAELDGIMKIQSGLQKGVPVDPETGLPTKTVTPDQASEYYGKWLEERRKKTKTGLTIAEETGAREGVQQPEGTQIPGQEGTAPGAPDALEGAAQEALDNAQHSTSSYPRIQGDGTQERPFSVPADPNPDEIKFLNSMPKGTFIIDANGTLQVKQ